MQFEAQGSECRKEWFCFGMQALPVLTCTWCLSVATFERVKDGRQLVVSGKWGSGVGDVDESTELGLLKAACVIESSGVSKKFKSNSEWASNFTSVISSTVTVSGSTIVELMLDESIWNTSMITVFVFQTFQMAPKHFGKPACPLIHFTLKNFHKFATFTAKRTKVHRWDRC